MESPPGLCTRPMEAILDREIKSGRSRCTRRFQRPPRLRDDEIGAVLIEFSEKRKKMLSCFAIVVARTQDLDALETESGRKLGLRFFVSQERGQPE